MGASFGRVLGLVYSEVQWGNALRQDPNRAGYADIAYMKNVSNPGNNGASDDFLQRFSPNINAAYHDRHNAFPDWMTKYTTSQSGNEWIPKNLEAATELTVNLLKYKFNDFYRPAYFELVNEPHWSYPGDQHFANWHLDLAKAVREADLGTQIGGPCSSVGYYYRNNYQDLKNFTQFIDNTNFELDFYSFHIYDYLHWNANQNDYTGRISSGSPIAGVIDALANYTRKNYGKELKMVISEHGGYELGGKQEETTTALANQYFPGSGFEWELERRSISNFNLVNSAITNTFVFMENPHIIQKAVPFILFETAGWDPTYYSSLMLPWDFSNTNKWAESKLIHFYRYFAGVQGRRVQMQCSDPDLQYACFVDGKQMHVLLNNMADKADVIDFKLAGTHTIETIKIRRVTRQADFRPAFTEETISELTAINIQAREALALEITFAAEITETSYINEIPFYSAEIAQEFQREQTFNVQLDHLDDIEYAHLRIGGQSACRY